MGLFAARFDGRCSSCGDDIIEGDSIGYIEGEAGVHCAGCVEAASDAESDYDGWDDDGWDTEEDDD